MTLPRSPFSTASYFITTLLWIFLTLHGSVGTALAVEKISLKKYPHLGIPVSNPIGRLAIDPTAVRTDGIDCRS